MGLLLKTVKGMLFKVQIEPFLYHVNTKEANGRLTSQQAADFKITLEQKTLLCLVRQPTNLLPLDNLLSRRRINVKIDRKHHSLHLLNMYLHTYFYRNRNKATSTWVPGN